MRQSDHRGMTLMEIVIVLVVIGILGVVVTPVLTQGLRSSATAQTTTALASEGRITLELMSQDLRNIRAATTTGPAITTMGANAITVTTMAGDTIDYSLNGTGLIRTVDGVPTILAEHVSSLQFEYFAGDGTTTTTINQVRYIGMQFEITQSDESRTFKVLVRVRNSP